MTVESELSKNYRAYENAMAANAFTDLPRDSWVAFANGRQFVAITRDDIYAQLDEANIGEAFVAPVNYAQRNAWETEGWEL
jgi:hypothetical protein